MKFTSPPLSVFFPAYNEEKNITATVSKADKVLQKLKIKSEIIIINDGSKDKTAEVSEQLVNKFPNVKLVNQHNGGYGMALRAGFENAKNEWIVYTDADGQFDFSEVRDRKSTRLNSSHTVISYAVFCLKKKKCVSDLTSWASPKRPAINTRPRTDIRTC